MIKRNQRAFFASTPQSPVTWFWGPSGDQNIAAGAGATLSTIANRVSAIMFVLHSPILINKLVISITTGAAASTGNVALYTQDGSVKLGDVSFSTAAIALISVTFPVPVFLSAGTFYIAWASTSAAVQAAGLSIPNQTFLVKNNANRMGANSTSGISTNNPLVGTVMPSSLLPFSSNNEGGIPAIMLET